MKYQKWLEEWQEHYVRIATKQRTAALNGEGVVIRYGKFYCNRKAMFVVGCAWTCIRYSYGTHDFIFGGRRREKNEIRDSIINSFF